MMQQTYKDVYDKILVDAPCSGLGVVLTCQKLNMFKRKQDIQDLVELQLEILDNVKDNLKPGGAV